MVSTYALSVDGASSLLDNVWVKQCLHSTWDPATALCGHLAGTTDCTSALKWPSHLFLLLYPVLLNPFIARETRSLYLLGLLARLWSRDFWVLLLEVCVHCYHAMLHMLICWYVDKARCKQEAGLLDTKTYWHYLRLQAASWWGTGQGRAQCPPPQQIPADRK